jgi:ribosomal protein S18 acetylase RimI-like enzyme
LTAAALARSGRTFTGLRPVDLRRDMASVADLIELAFAGRLDPTGQRMLREMRRLGRAGWIGWLVGWLTLPRAAYAQGFVWEEDGRLVGNASLMGVEGYPGRMVLANVAVDPDHRRKGIARALVQASVDSARRRGGTKILLQVESDNQGALDLYTFLGFRALTTRTTWERLPGDERPTTPGEGAARRRRGEEWRQEWALANRLHPEGLVWPYPLHVDLFRPAGAGSGRAARLDWVWPQAGPLAACLTARPITEPRGWRLILVTEPEVRGKAEGPLLAAALADRKGPLILEAVAGPGDHALAGSGFTPRRTLTWMDLDLMSTAQA